MSQELENKTTSELMVIIYIVNCIVMESSEIAIKVANTLATFWSMKKKHNIKGHSAVHLEKKSGMTGIASRPFG